ncbi:MAG: peroxiredoxin [Oligoflexales bacterium]|nr:peroxiredoxin [Oligoflexales bacterium]
MAIDLGSKAPLFSLKNQDGELVSLEANLQKKWTVLYFYPKADTPGCTKQACAFRDSLKVIEKEGAVVYGISTNSVQDLKDFQKKYNLNFTLLSDPDATVSKQYDAKYPLLKIAKRYTYIVDPELKIRSIDTDVDPVLDAKKVSEKLIELQKAAAKSEDKKNPVK